MIEIKSAPKVDERHAKGLLSLGPELNSKQKILISNDPDTKQFSDVLACPWNEAIERILDE